MWLPERVLAPSTGGGAGSQARSALFRAARPGEEQAEEALAAPPSPYSLLSAPPLGRSPACAWAGEVDGPTHHRGVALPSPHRSSRLQPRCQAEDAEWRFPGGQATRAAGVGSWPTQSSFRQLSAPPSLPLRWWKGGIGRVPWDEGIR